MSIMCVAYNHNSNSIIREKLATENCLCSNENQLILDSEAVQEVIEKYGISILEQSAVVQFLTSGQCFGQNNNLVDTNISENASQLSTSIVKESMIELDKENIDSNQIVLDSTIESLPFGPQVLQRLLEQNLFGKAILEKATQGPLSERRQLELAQVIAEWHLENRIKLYENDLKTYSKAIALLFPSENEESYYLPKGGDKKNPGGKVYNKINTIKSRLRKRSKEDEDYLNSLKSGKRPNIDTELFDSCAIEARKWLLINKAPWSTVLDNWTVTFGMRKSFLDSSVALDKLIKADLWNLVTSEHGYQLIDIDFRLLELGNEDGSIKWSTVLGTIQLFFQQRIKDECFSELLHCLCDKALNQDNHLCAVILLLNCVLHPQKVAGKYKPTIVNGIADSILFASSNDDAATKLKALYSRYQDFGLPASSKLIFFGTDYKNLTGIFRVYYGDLFYTLPTVSRAIDVFIKFTAVLGLKHSKFSYLVWLFISRYIYEIKRQERCVY
ncbi:uncharacterized protein LOC131432781 [Malaya genurostris]|uniref:uncharacterized protein LOC131432781 n=1 Tax=Malaya genurostris TaxID=325434 RepID=UPI0026F3A747|nr:uncharacterized protein LOC131432781 [Malaya genurostris]